MSYAPDMQLVVIYGWLDLKRILDRFADKGRTPDPLSSSYLPGLDLFNFL